MAGIICNPFLGRTDGVKWNGNVYAEKDYAQCTIVQRVNHLSKDDDTAFDVIQDINITDIVDRQDYINSFADDVGILNILKKVVRSGDTALLKQCEPGYIDMTNMPGDFLEAKAMYDSAMNAYEQLPEEIKQGMTAQEFAKITAENLDKSLKQYVDGLTPKAEVNKTEVKDVGGKVNE